MEHPVDGALRGGAVQALFHGKALSWTLKVEVSGTAQKFLLSCSPFVDATFLPIYMTLCEPWVRARDHHDPGHFDALRHFEASETTAVLSCHQSELISVDLMISVLGAHTVHDRRFNNASQRRRSSVSDWSCCELFCSS